MRVATLKYDAAGWSRPFPDWDSDQTLVLMFGSPGWAEDPTPILDLVDAFSSSHVIGCSTAGEIFNDSVHDESLSVAVVRFDHSQIRSTWAPVTDASESFRAGATLGRTLSGDDLAAVFVLSEGLTVNGTDLALGITQTVGERTIVTGGLAGDGDRFSATWVLAEGKIRPGVVAGIGIYGERANVGYGFRGGWDIFGPERMVSRSSGNILYELDGKPALDLYEEYLGERAADLPASGLLFPLALRHDGSDHQLVRTILAVDREKRSLTFAGDVPQGAYAQLMQANFDRLIEGAESAAFQANERATIEGEALSIAISCVGRRLVLGARAEEEVEATLDAVPNETAQVGFYSYGELSPGGVGSCELHNQTMTLTTISERSAD